MRENKDRPLLELRSASRKEFVMPLFDTDGRTFLEEHEFGPIFRLKNLEARTPQKGGAPRTESS